ncbi:unnamed protein product [Durusdinium trenchii]|uniref:Vesicle transport protein n=1 Tax=Durusdinium trenchii TaxID=1381693 RepID=A0ABP0RUD8_9DINO
MDESQANVAFTLAKEFSTSALTTTMDMAGKVKDYIQRGPEGVGYLCFVGGAASVFLGLLGFLDIAGILMSPLQYLVNAYQTGFGLVVCVLEAPPEWLSNARLAKAQRFIHEFAKFLTTFGGRGLFYLFQGSLDLSLDTYSLTWLVGCYMCCMGGVCIGMQYGLLPEYRDRDPPQANGLYHSMLLSFMSSFHIQRFVEELKTALCNL